MIEKNLLNAGWVKISKDEWKIDGSTLWGSLIKHKKNWIFTVQEINGRPINGIEKFKFPELNEVSVQEIIEMLNSNIIAEHDSRMKKFEKKMDKMLNKMLNKKS